MPIISQSAAKSARATTGATATKKVSATLAKRRAQGVDISHWQYQINPSRASVPLDFVIYKASESTFKDKRFDQHYGSTKSVPIKGAYHFLATGNINAQVDAFLKAVEGKALDFFAVDVEKNDVTGAPVNAMTAQDAREFRRQVEERTGKPVFLYTNQSILQQYFNRPGDENIPLWFAQPNKTWTNPQLPGNRTWAIWQNAWDAPASQFGLSRYDRGVDFNVFAGTPEDMRAYINSLTKGQGFDLHQSAARTSGSLSSMGIGGAEKVQPVFSENTVSQLFQAAVPTQAITTAEGKEQSKPSSITGAVASAGAAPQPKQTSTAGDILKVFQAGASGTAKGIQSEETTKAAKEGASTMLENLLGIDAASLGFIIVGIILFVVGIVIMFRRAPIEE